MSEVTNNTLMEQVVKNFDKVIEINDILGSTIEDLKSKTSLFSRIDKVPSQSQITNSNPGIVFSVFLCSSIKLWAA